MYARQALHYLFPVMHAWLRTITATQALHCGYPVTTAVFLKCVQEYCLCSLSDVLAEGLHLVPPVDQNIVDLDTVGVTSVITSKGMLAWACMRQAHESGMLTQMGRRAWEGVHEADLMPPWAMPCGYEESFGPHEDCYKAWHNTGSARLSRHHLLSSPLLPAVPDYPS